MIPLRDASKLLSLILFNKIWLMIRINNYKYFPIVLSKTIHVNSYLNKWNTTVHTAGFNTKWSVSYCTHYRWERNFRAYLSAVAYPYTIRSTKQVCLNIISETKKLGCIDRLREGDHGALGVHDDTKNCAYVRLVFSSVQCNISSTCLDVHWYVWLMVGNNDKNNNDKQF